MAGAFQAQVNVPQRTQWGPELIGFRDRAPQEFKLLILESEGPKNQAVGRDGSLTPLAPAWR